MKLLGVVLALLLIASTSFAETPKSKFTGYDYLKLADAEKMNVVASFIDIVKASGIGIKQEPVAYCKKLEDFYKEHTDFKGEPLVVVLKMIMIVENDWK